MGHLSPLDGIRPSDIGLDLLDYRLSIGDVEEVILATNPTVEGRAYRTFAQLCKAHGVNASHCSWCAYGR